MIMKYEWGRPLLLRAGSKDNLMCLVAFGE